MEEGERVVDYFSRVLNLVNQMRGCSEQITDVIIMENIMFMVTQSINHIIVAIEESKEVENMKIEELQGSLEAQALKLIQRNQAKVVDQALQAQVKEGLER